MVTAKPTPKQMVKATKLIPKRIPGETVDKLIRRLKGTVQ